MLKSFTLSPSICDNNKHLKYIIKDCNCLPINYTCYRKCINKCDKYYTNIILLTNVASTLSINSDDKRVRCKTECYILYTFLLASILLFRITIVWYYDASYW